MCLCDSMRSIERGSYCVCMKYNIIQMGSYFTYTFTLFVLLLLCIFYQEAAAFREFLLVKLINGEKATFQTPTFSREL